jgi:hypothetical protein
MPPRWSKLTRLWRGSCGEKLGTPAAVSLSGFLRLSSLAIAGVVEAELELGLALQVRRRAKEKEKPEPAERNLTTTWQSFEEYRRDRPTMPRGFW